MKKKRIFAALAVALIVLGLCFSVSFYNVYAKDHRSNYLAGFIPEIAKPTTKWLKQKNGSFVRQVSISMVIQNNYRGMMVTATISRLRYPTNDFLDIADEEIRCLTEFKESYPPALGKKVFVLARPENKDLVLCDAWL
jgi:hypothetical protein